MSFKFVDLRISASAVLRRKKLWHFERKEDPLFCSTRDCCAWVLSESPCPTNYTFRLYNLIFNEKTIFLPLTWLYLNLFKRRKLTLLGQRTLNSSLSLFSVSSGTPPCTYVALTVSPVGTEPSAIQTVFWHEETLVLLAPSLTLDTLIFHQIFCINLCLRGSGKLHWGEGATKMQNVVSQSASGHWPGCK